MIVLVKKFLMINNKNIICLKLKENMMIKMMQDKLTVYQENKLFKEMMIIIRIFQV